VVRSADETRAADHPIDDAIDHVIDRRSLLRIGGLSAAGAALLAACGVGPGGGEEEGAAAPTTTTQPARGDVSIFQTATTLEALAIEVYQRAIQAGVITTAAVVEAAELLVEHHQEHQSLFSGETSKLGAKVAAGVNSTLQARVEDQIAGMTSEADALRLILDIERALAATYQANTRAVGNPALRVRLMSVGGVEARHVSVISAALGEPLYPEDGFQTTAGAVTPTT